ncbi:MAG: Rieske 2Fe-2S domain-containing protein [Candidatus Solibacter usitatus]|nr:Rieske 2Fe-2S domain-containing protein [Candidatus Solibacter usitatus]
MQPSGYIPTPDLSRASTLPAHWYVDPEYLDVEKQRIFWRTWQAVGHADAVAHAGDYLACEVLGEPLVVVRGEDGVLHAFSNVCRHRASTIAEGQGNCRALRCPYHGWTYGLDGRLLGQPEFEGVQNWDRSSVCLPAMPVETWGPFLFVRLDSGGPPLTEVLGDIPREARRLGCNLDRLRFYQRKDYLLNCNWKVYVDNYLEGYHVPVAHPGLFRELDYSRYRVETHRYYSSHYAPIRPAQGDPERRYTSDGAAALYYWIFPNFMLNIYPDNLSSNIILPLGHDRTLTIFEWFFPPEHLAPDSGVARRTLAFSDEIQIEDIKLCENVQRGLRSRTYDTGRLSVKRENGVHHFHMLMHEFLTA